MSQPADKSEVRNLTAGGRRAVGQYQTGAGGAQAQLARLRGKAGQRIEDAALRPGVKLVQLPHQGHGHAGASAPPSSTLRSIVFPSITWSSPTSESRTALRTTRTLRPTIAFAIALSVTKLPASSETLGPTVASWIVTPSSM